MLGKKKKLPSFELSHWEIITVSLMTLIWKYKRVSVCLNAQHTSRKELW